MKSSTFFIASFFIFNSFLLGQQKPACTSGDCQNGFGIYLFADSSYYIGNFINGKQDGHGFYHETNGMVTDGTWSKGLREGKFIATDVSGNKFYSTYVNGKKHGSSKIEDKAGKILSRQHWDNGTLMENKSKVGEPVNNPKKSHPNKNITGTKPITEIKEKSLSITQVTMINDYSPEIDAINNSDSRKSIKIGTQEWTSENLNVPVFRNGDVIPEVKNTEAWVKAGKDGKPAWCYYDNDPNNGTKYGKLYNWYALTDPRGLAPSGWHIPTSEEWIKLIDYLGGEHSANKMRSKIGWGDNGNRNNESGFSGLHGGFRTNEGEFKNDTYWWSSTEWRPDFAWSFMLSYMNTGVYKHYKSMRTGCAVRCVKD